MQYIYSISLTHTVPISILYFKTSEFIIALRNFVLNSMYDIFFERTTDKSISRPLGSVLIAIPFLPQAFLLISLIEPALLANLEALRRVGNPSCVIDTLADLTRGKMMLPLMTRAELLHQSELDVLQRTILIMAKVRGGNLSRN